MTELERKFLHALAKWYNVGNVADYQGFNELRNLKSCAANLLKANEGHPVYDKVMVKRTLLSRMNLMIQKRMNESRDYPSVYEIQEWIHEVEKL